MKNIVLSIIAVALFFIGCDKIEGPYYQELVSEPVTAEFPPIDLTKVERKIYFEEYTGHRCPNCPNAQAYLTSLQPTYGDKLITMCVHITRTFAAPLGDDFVNDYRTPVGDELAAFSGADNSGLPAGWANRVKYSTEDFITFNSWSDNINSVDNSYVPAAIQMVPEVSATRIKMNVKVAAIENVDRPVLFSLYLTEDGIISPQKTSGETIYDYEHNHMLRSGFDNVKAFGNRFSHANAGKLLAGEAYEFAYSVAINEEWVVNNCSVIGLLVDEETKEVIQAEKVYLGTGGAH